MINTLRRFLAPDVAYVQPPPLHLRDYAPFLAIALLYPIFLLVTNPYWMLGGQMWAEMATNYYVNSQSNSWMTRLFSTDAGYIPLPQRMIAAFVAVIGMPSVSVPYFYTWSAAIITGLMVASFTLPIFRHVVRSDVIRAVASLTVLLMVDFDTRTFINFTYFGGFVATIVTALALSLGRTEVPRWTWIVPFLLLSKPAVLAALPAMLLAALFTGRRFRWIAVASLVVGLIQFVRLLFSRAEGVIPQAVDSSILEKLLAAAVYILALPAAFLNGPANNNLGFWFFAAGFLFFSGCVFIFTRNALVNKSLLFSAGSLFVFTILLNCMTLSDSWNLGMERLGGPSIYRHTVVGFMALVLLMTSLSHNMAELLLPKRSVAGSYLAPAMFLIWFLAAGWQTTLFTLNRNWTSPLLNNSYWHELADDLDAGADPLCIPIDPINWLFGKNCSSIGAPPVYAGYAPLTSLRAGELTVPLTLPQELSHHTLTAFSILIRPSPLQKKVTATARINLRDGRRIYLTAEREMLPTGGMLIFHVVPEIAGIDIVSINLDSETDTELAIQTNGSNNPLAIYMGH